MKRTAAIAAVCVAAVLPYLAAVNDYFVQDDFGVVWLLSHKPWTSFPRWFIGTWMDDIWGFTPDEIRPFPALTYQIAAAWGAGSPVANHVINIALHACNGLLVVAIAHTLARLPLAAATVAALVFVLLPVQAESVAWVTGRVDSMPALFYFAAFLLYGLWRREGRPTFYWVSVAIFFVALFTKQNTITFGPALVLYDAIVERRAVDSAGRWIRPYIPFAALTVGYLGLRYALFGEMARESQLTWPALEHFRGVMGRHLRLMIFGDVADGTPILWTLVGLLVIALLRFAPRVTLFAGAWWLLGVLPAIVATYESPRHVYLASLGWALLLGLAADRLSRHQRWRIAAVIVSTGVLAIYSTQLVRIVADWGTRALVSQRAVGDLQREARDAPRGALIIAIAPVESWEWALPFVLRPPFAASNLEPRVRVITPQALHCCRSQWETFTRDTLRHWLLQSPSPIVALRWDPVSGTLRRLTDREEPYLRSLVQVLVETDSAAALDRAIRSVLDGR